MKKILKVSVITLLLLTLKNYTYAQGCSDAGFCTIGNLGVHKQDTVLKAKGTLVITLPFGVGDENVFVFTPGIEYSRSLSAKWSVQGKVTANYATGNLGNAIGLGDLFLAGTYHFKTSSGWKKSFTLGTKLPLNQGNLKAYGRSLPMQYQSSLGTVDLISGLAINNKQWQLALGWQQPLTGINRNNFLPVYWNKPSAVKYPPSNDFNRKADLLLRTAYTFSLNNKLRITAGLLGIYHLGEDTYIDANVSPTPIGLKGSEGITINTTAAATYSLNKKVFVGLSGGVPLVVRDLRPDGLTRSFVISPEIRFNF